MPRKEEGPTWVQAREAIVIAIGDRASVYRTAIVRNRHTGQLAEVELNELEPIEPGVTGESYAFGKGERVLSDHPAVVAKPDAFVEAREVVLAEQA